MAPVYLALRKSSKLQPFLVSTGQHREMLDQALNVFGLKVDIDLKLMQKGQVLSELTAKVLLSMAPLLRDIRPAALLVQGDTTTVLGASLAAFYENVKLGHVEAGLRTYNLKSPWPEELNRQLTSRIANWNFTPTSWSAQNLLSEKTDPAKIHITGNTVIDALLSVRDKLSKQGGEPNEIANRNQIPENFFRKYLRQFESSKAGSEKAKLILVTGHRRESFGEGFEDICRAITKLVARNPDVGILYPVHLNPNVQEPVYRMLGGNERIALIPPVSYEDFIWLMNQSYLILTDSGGVQEEGPSLGKPILVMRDTTERPEGISAGTCKLVGTNAELICKEVEILLGDNDEYKRRSALKNPYGEGVASDSIVKILERDLE